MTNVQHIFVLSPITETELVPYINKAVNTYGITYRSTIHKSVLFYRRQLFLMKPEK
jgi:hypothetical protein